MESLAYLYLALAHETSADADCTASICAIQKLLASAAYSLLAATVALGILGKTRIASAMVQQGDRGEEVSALQQRLAELGYFQGNVTGYFGAVTKRAVIKFQRAKGLEPDGIVGADTQVYLREKPSSSSSDKFLQLGDRGDRVSDIQQRLAVAGLSSGEKSVFDRATEDAVRRFQESKGLTVDGIVGAQTLAALPEINDSNTKKVKKRIPSWYEDESAPLVPFTRKPD